MTIEHEKESVIEIKNKRYLKDFTLKYRKLNLFYPKIACLLKNLVQ